MDIDRPEVVAEVTAAFEGYEKALVADDVQQVICYFWDSADVVRFGIADHQVGATAQRVWREDQPPLPVGRRLHDTRITTFGTDFAVINTFFSYPGGVVVGRQSQTWARLPEGWRIVGAHVSEVAAAAT